jgi:hypothetical protein
MSAQKDLQGLGSFEAACRFRERAVAADRSDLAAPPAEHRVPHPPERPPAEQRENQDPDRS